MWFHTVLRRNASGPASRPALMETLEGRRLLCGGPAEDYSGIALDGAVQSARPARPRHLPKLARAARSAAARPSITISDVTRLEGDSDTRAFAFTVSLSARLSKMVSVRYATADGAAASAGGDYSAVSGRLKFAPGELSKTVTVQVLGDTAIEPDEAFFVNLSDAENAIIADGRGVGTILNDDVSPPEAPDPTVSISDFWVEEGDDALRSLVLSISLSAASSKPVSIDYATEDGTALAADNDYQPAFGSVTFAPGETTREITLVTYADTAVEADEMYFVKLSRPVNAVIGDGFGTVTIANDDGPPPPPDEGGGGDCTADHPYYPNC